MIATERLGPAIKRLWESRRSDRPKWGDLRNTFRREHCYRVNPYGSETCPFRDADCAMAFYAAVESSLYATNPHGYFKAVCRSTGAARADLGAELRARMRTDVTIEGAVDRTGPPGVRAGPRDRLRAEPEPPVVRGMETPDTVRGVRRMATGPVPLGDVLRTFDLGSPARPRRDGDEDEGSR
jgi:hypothetical protein